MKGSEIVIKTKENSIKQVAVKDRLIDTYLAEGVTTAEALIKLSKDKIAKENVDTSKNAISSVEHIGETTAFESTRRAKNYVIKKHREKRK